LAETVHVGDCLQDGYLSLERLQWTATDGSGNVVVVELYVRIVDTTAPVITGVPADIAVDCANVPAPASPDVTDNCDVDPSLTFEEILDGDDCNYTITRTWTATDNCGNTATVAQVITVTDQIAPVITGVPDDVTVDCSDIPLPAAPSVADNCDNDVNLVFDEVRAGDDCRYTLTRTWSAEDDCGNYAVQTQVVTVVDTLAPVIDGVMDDVLVDCDNIPDPFDPFVYDNCDPDVALTFDEVRAGDDCSYTLTRTWTAQDDCGNTSIAVQIITVVDNDAPVFVHVPADIILDCTDTIPLVDLDKDVEAVDNCDTLLDITYTMDVNGDCPKVISCIFSATDDCGNVTYATQTITIIDTIAPVITDVPEDMVLSCNDPVPPPATPTVTDNCDDDVDVVFDEVINGDNCDYTITRVWTATDDCGNVSTAVQVITVTDGDVPVIVFVNPHFVNSVSGDTVDIDCGNVPVFGPNDVEVIDNDPVVDLDFLAETVHVGDCLQDGYLSLERLQWTATDGSGNVVVVELYVRIVDTTAPVITGVPADVSVDCANVPAPASPDVTDNCDIDPSLTFEEILNGDDCNYTITRIWTATDNCGNITTVAQVITVTDQIAPVFAGIPADITVDCGSIPNPAVPTVTDNCDPDISYVFNESPLTGNCIDDYSIIRTWTASDRCGNTTTTTQVINIEDNTAPQILVSPTSIALECDEDIPEPDAVATDNCDAFVDLIFDETVMNGDCPNNYTIVRTWTATDDCGNTSIETQTITVEDTQAPVLIGVPADMTVDLSQGGTVPPPAVVTAEDNCSRQVSVVFDEERDDVGCDYILSRIWSSEDECGNVASVTQVITVLGIPLQVEIISTTPDTCAAGIGTALLSPDNYTYLWSDGATGYNRTDLIAGTYQVIASDGTDCTAEITVIIGDDCDCILAVVDSVALTPATCLDNDGTATIELTGDEADYTYYWTPELGSPNAIGNGRTGLPSGDYQVDILYQGDIDCQVSTSFTVPFDCNPPPCDTLFTQNQVIIQTDSGRADVCLPVIGSTYGYDIFLDGSNYTAPFDSCGEDSLVYYTYASLMLPGPYLVNEWTVNGTTFTNHPVADMDELAAWMQSNNPTANWSNSPTTFTLEGGDYNSDYGVLRITNIRTLQEVIMQINNTTVPYGEAIHVIGIGTHLVVATDSLTGCSDSLIVILEEISPLPSDFIPVKFELIVTNCTDGEPDYCVNGVSQVDFDDFEIREDSELYEGEIGGCAYTFNLNYSFDVLPGKGAEGPYTLERWIVGGREIVAHSVLDIVHLVQIMNDNDPYGEWILDVVNSIIYSNNNDNDDYGSLVISQDNTGAITKLDLNTNNIPTGTALMSLSHGIHELEFTRLIDGMKDTITLAVACVQPETKYDTIMVGQIETICIEDTDLLGAVAFIGMMCDGNDEFATLEQVPGTNCFTYTGVEVGFEDACFVICDDYGVCDTTYLNITIDRELQPVVAAPDTIRTPKNTPVTINPVENDDLNGQPGTLTIVTQPENGTAEVVDNQTIIYTPNEGYCDEDQPDIITYEICNEDGNCAITTIAVYVDCDDIIVYTGFSPNGDQINDYLRIEGLDKYPKHELTVFNRWGNVVLNTKDYKNDWYGEWLGEDLPDGTYFYVIEDGEGRTISGYIQIWR